MARPTSPSRWVRGSEPNARGDGPPSRCMPTGSGSRAPRTWGWTDDIWNLLGDCGPSPTHVGMDRSRARDHVRQRAEPPALGDGPCAELERPDARTRAPRTWGWTESARGLRRGEGPSPTQV